MTATRIYVVTEDGRQDRLVEAANSAQALRYAAGQRFTAAVAGVRVVASLISAGVKIEQAGAEPAED